MTSDEDRVEPLITELALVSGLGVIPRVYAEERPRQVYLAQSDDGLCKIGVSASAGTRIRALSRNRADDVKLLHAFPADDAEGAERELHTQYRINRVWGEWFKLSASEIQTICNYKAYRAGQFIGGGA